MEVGLDDDSSEFEAIHNFLLLGQGYLFLQEFRNLGLGSQAS